MKTSEDQEVYFEAVKKDSFKLVASDKDQAYPSVIYLNKMEAFTFIATMIMEYHKGTKEN